MNRIILFAAVLSTSLFLVDTAAAGERNATFTKMVVKQHAERYEDNGGLSRSGRELYVYVKDDDIRKSIDAAENADRSLPEGALSIASPTIDKQSKIKKVEIVVDAQKGIKVNRKRLGLTDEEISIANPSIEDGAKVKKVNVLVDARKGGIKVK